VRSGPTIAAPIPDRCADSGTRREASLGTVADRNRAARPGRVMPKEVGLMICSMSAAIRTYDLLSETRDELTEFVWHSERNHAISVDA
jgi:hypothetical protein